MEVGSTEISIRNLLQLNQGSVVELDRLAGEPLDVLVNEAGFCLNQRSISLSLIFRLGVGRFILRFSIKTGFGLLC